MAIIGEKLRDYVISQINQRQQKLGNITKDDENLVYFNAKTAWVKLASGVKVTKEKLKELSIGFTDAEADSLKGKNLAQSYILFGGTSNLNNQTLIQKEGLGGNSSYDADPEFGPVPMPGLKDVNIRCLNRGSLKKAKIKIKVETRTQLEIIDILYLRLGYTLFLEWGNSHYFNSSGELQNTQSTLIEKKFFDDSFSKKSFLNILPEIEKERKTSGGNYDGFVGKVSNFDWSFNDDGSYDINLELISLGDVIESLKSNVVLDPVTNEYIKISTAGSTNSNLIGEGSVNSNRTLNSIFSILYLWKAQNSQQRLDSNAYGSIINKALSIKNISDPNVFSNTTSIDQHLYIGDILDIPTSATATYGTGTVQAKFRIGYVKAKQILPTAPTSIETYDPNDFARRWEWNTNYGAIATMKTNYTTKGVFTLRNKILKSDKPYVEVLMEIPITEFTIPSSGLSKFEALTQISNFPSLPASSTFQSSVKGGLKDLDPSGTVDTFLTWSDITEFIKYGKPASGPGTAYSSVNFTRDFQNDFSSFLPNATFQRFLSGLQPKLIKFFWVQSADSPLRNLKIGEWKMDNTFPSVKYYGTTYTGVAAARKLLSVNLSGLPAGKVFFNGRDIQNDILNIFNLDWSSGAGVIVDAPLGFSQISYPNSMFSYVNYYNSGGLNRYGTGKNKEDPTTPNDEKHDSPRIEGIVQIVPPSGSTSISSISVPNPLRNFEDGDVVRLYTISESKPIFSFYMRFGAVLNMLKNEVLSRIKVNSATNISTYNNNPNIVNINTENDSNSSNFVSYMKYKPRLTSFDISKCIVNSSLELEGTGSSGDYSYNTFNNTSGLKNWKFSKNVTRVSGSSYKTITENYGNSMNIYLSFESIGSNLQSNTDSEGNISVYSFIKAMCNTINRSFAEVNNLEPVIDETSNILSIIDSSLNQSSGIRDYELNPFGFIKNNTEGSFVRKVDLKTAITPGYATMVTVGATAGGYVKGVEATSFSRWNEGITDRFKTELVPASKDAEVSNKDEGIQSSFENFDRIWLPEDDSRLLPFGITTPIADATPGFSTIPGSPSSTYPDKVGDVQFNDTIIKENLQIATEYFRAFSAKSEDGGSIGFIPFNVGLKMDGISGIKIYNEIILNTRFLPRNYNSNLSFITTAVNHSLKDGDWETELKLTLIPTAITQDYDPPKRSSFVRTSIGGGTPPSGTGIARYLSCLDSSVKTKSPTYRTTNPKNGVTVTPRANGIKIAQALKAAGYTRAGAQAMLGNIIKESGIIPARLEGDSEGRTFSPSGYTPYQVYSTIGSKGGYGLVQWTAGRRRKLEKDPYGFYGTPGAALTLSQVDSLDYQIDYLLKETQNSYPAVYSTLTTSNDISECVLTLLLYNIRPQSAIDFKNAIDSGSTCSAAPGRNSVQNRIDGSWEAEDIISSVY